MPKQPQLRKLALSTLIAGFDGTSAPDWALRLLDEGLAGYCLFDMNIAGSKQVKALTQQLRDINPDVLIAIDEEGGDVTRLYSRSGSPYPGNAALGQVDNPDLTRRIYHAIGSELAEVGVNIDFAPDVDINVTDANPVIGTRSFGHDPELVARHSAAAVTGLQEAGVAACAKHFPGHGATTTDSHLALPCVDTDIDTLHERELVPFEAAIKAGSALVMSGHIRVPELTGQLPSTLAPAAMHDLLRQKLGFAGAIVTDAIEMSGVSSDRGMPEAAVAALQAGCDLICTGGERQKLGPLTGLVDDIATTIVDAVIEGRLPLSRLEDAASRATSLRAGLQDNSALRDAHELGFRAARAAIRVEGEPPALQDSLLLQIGSGTNLAVGGTGWGVAPLARKSVPPEQVQELTTAGADIDAIVAAAAGRPIIVAARDIHRRNETRELICALTARTRTAVVDLGWPTSWRPTEAIAYVATFGASAANAKAAVALLSGSDRG
ncbi:MAG TPA: glycoside hydrolase family 3 protein [Candidatus Stackebrandtia faecavium]|nr:glycoside hydrolase family 3 protein [Candidatus Stackebrandtia faecavium]